MNREIARKVGKGLLNTGKVIALPGSFALSLRGAANMDKMLGLTDTFSSVMTRAGDVFPNFYQPLEAMPLGMRLLATSLITSVSTVVFLIAAHKSVSELSAEIERENMEYKRLKQEDNFWKRHKDRLKDFK